MNDLVELTQPKLIDMKECHIKETPTMLTPLGSDGTGAPWKEIWSYASVVGKLLYLAGYTCTDLAFAINQVGHYTHHPQQEHKEAIKHICCYLQGVWDQGYHYFHP